MAEAIIIIIFAIVVFCCGIAVGYTLKKLENQTEKQEGDING